LLEGSADTHHDHIHRGQDKSENGPQLALDSVSRGVWHCFAQHLENSAQISATLPRRPILRPVLCHFPIYLGPGVYGHGVCLHSLHCRRYSVTRLGWVECAGPGRAGSAGGAAHVCIRTHRESAQGSTRTRAKK
jgi:hypothetical protein